MTTVTIILIGQSVRFAAGEPPLGTGGVRPGTPGSAGGDHQHYAVIQLYKMKKGGLSYPPRKNKYYIYKFL